MTRQEIPVFKTREENVAYMNATLPIRESFDLIQRDLLIGGRVSSFYYVNGFTSEETMLKIMDALLKVKEEDMPEDIWKFANACIPYVGVDVMFDFDQILKSLLSGETCVFIDGYRACIVIDCRMYPARNVEEPDKDKSLRGSRDGFVETIVYNTAMMRRRIRHPALIMEMMEVGDSSRTDVALCYMGDRADKTLLKNVRDKIQSIDTDDLRMNQQSLAECLFKRKWYNPFPKFKFTERPDTASACLLEGKVVILVDNSPSAMILPTSVFDMIEEANDYYFPTLTSVYLKISRTLINLMTIFLTPVFLGEFSVESGWFNSEVMLYMAFVAVANYTQPNFELGYALKFMRLALLILTALFNGWGFVMGCVLVVCSICFNKTLSGRSYLHVSLK